MKPPSNVPPLQATSGKQQLVSSLSFNKSLSQHKVAEGKGVDVIMRSTFNYSRML